MKIHLWKSSCCCAADEHETGCYPRSSFKPKPELPAGTILTVKEKWQNLGANAKEGIQTKWNEFTEWWNNTGIYKWWNEHVAPWFTKAKWQEFGSNIKEGM